MLAVELASSVTVLVPRLISIYTPKGYELRERPALFLTRATSLLATTKAKDRPIPTRRIGQMLSSVPCTALAAAAEKPEAVEVEIISISLCSWLINALIAPVYSTPFPLLAKASIIFSITRKASKIPKTRKTREDMLEKVPLVAVPISLNAEVVPLPS